jgi:AraC-like DNA-binding protein
MNANELAQTEQGPVVGAVATFTSGQELPFQLHPEGQLLSPALGLVVIETDDGRWTLPPRRALWVPSGQHFAFEFHEFTYLNFVYVRADWVPSLMDDVRLLDASLLLRGLIDRIVELPWMYSSQSHAYRLAQVFVDEIAMQASAPLHLPMPHDPRARCLAERLRACPSDRSPLADWAKSVGASERTLGRLFRKETGLSVGLWRERLRMQTAVAELAQGRRVAVVAEALGYASVSGFIETFRRFFGTTPGRYLEEGEEGPCIPGIDVDPPA